ncbi:hypothetical protein [Nocardia sp. NPDC050710]|uniref:hypothetical protein n=1 Tax=Nocardia sp. NPDC050710 TaxID=3157220 RepID=UPI0033C0368B
MGFYDCNCMITGVSLMGIDATLVVLQRRGEIYLPITLGIAGTYDRLGGVDGVREDLNTELVLRYFVDRYRDGRFFAEDQTSISVGDWLTSDSDIEELLQVIERTHLAIGDDIYSASTLLDGHMIVFALIAQPVWDAIVDRVPAPNQSLGRQFRRLFGTTVAAADIYQARLPELVIPLGQLAEVNNFVEAHGLRWAPASEPSQRYPTDYGGQHYDEKIREFLDRAKHDYRNDPVVLTGLANYGRLVEWEEDDDSDVGQTTPETAAEILLEWAANMPDVQTAVRIHSDETDQS